MEEEEEQFSVLTTTTLLVFLFLFTVIHHIVKALIQDPFTRLSSLNMAEPTPSHPEPTPSNFPGDTVASTASEQAALSDAASKLKVSDSTSTANGTSPVATKADGPAKVDIKKVKVDPKDVEFLVKELEVSKVKATEMLKAANGERKEAVRTFVVGVGA